jgi:hypothetical protein
VELYDFSLKSRYNVYLNQVFQVSKLRVFPKLSRVHFCVYSRDAWKDVSYIDCIVYIHKYLAPDLRAAGYGMVIEQMDVSIRDLNRQ